jgi:hypothetical protein
MRLTNPKFLIPPTLLLLLAISVSCKKTGATSMFLSAHETKSAGDRSADPVDDSSGQKSGFFPLCKLDASSNSGPVAGCYCYPDILPKLTRTLRDAILKFRANEGVMQNLRCENILGEFSEAFGGWDLEFPTDYTSKKLNESSYAGAPCGTCVYTAGTKVCYEAKIFGKSYLYDMWDVNYALYGTIQKLCGISENEAWVKVAAWKKLKGEFSETVWFWFKFGYMLADSSMPSTSDGILKKLKIPESDPRYENKCHRCPDGAWKNPSSPMNFKSYLFDKRQ